MICSFWIATTLHTYLCIILMIYIWYVITGSAGLGSPIPPFFPVRAQLGEHSLDTSLGGQGTGAWQWYMKLCHLRLMWDERRTWVGVVVVVRDRHRCQTSCSPCRTEGGRAACKDKKHWGKTWWRNQGLFTLLGLITVTWVFTSHKWSR